MSRPSKLPSGPNSRPLRWAVGLALTVAFVALFAPRAVGGSTSYIIVSGTSMSPTFEDGDLVIVREGSYQAGDVVAFETGSGIVIHRIVGGSAEEGYLLQGDNRTAPDTWRPTPDAVVGEEWFHIPGAGSGLGDVMANPWMLGMLSGGLSTLLVWSPTRRGRHGAHTRERRNVRRRSPTAGAPTALPVLVALGLAASGLAILTVYLFQLSLQRTVTSERTLFEHAGSYHYTASVQPSIVYGGTAITPDSTEEERTVLYTQLLNELQVEFSYEARGLASTDLEGQMSADLHIRAGDNPWIRTLPLLPPRPLADNRVSEAFAVDVPRLLELTRRAEAETGFTPSSYDVRIVSRVEVDAGDGSPQVFTAELPMRLDETVLSIQNDLSTAVPVETTEQTVRPNEVGLLGLSLPVRQARILAGAAFVTLTLVAAGYGFWALRRVGPGEAGRIRLRYGPLIVPVSGDAVNGSRPIEVDSMSDLARLARRAEQMILYQQNGEERFLVPDGPVVYEYRPRRKRR